MTLGGNLTVTNTSAYENFNVKFARNIEITNFTQRDMGEAGDIRAQVKNGQSGTAERIYSNGKKSDRLATLDLNSKRYAIFDALRKLDGNESDLSEKDLSLAEQLDKKALGIKNIRRDSNAGVTTIVCDDGAVLKFDIETKDEQQVREAKEAENAKQRAKEAEARKAEKQRQDKELHENCKSTLEKCVEWFLDLF